VAEKCQQHGCDSVVKQAASAGNRLKLLDWWQRSVSSTDVTVWSSRQAAAGNRLKLLEWWQRSVSSTDVTVWSSRQAAAGNRLKLLDWWQRSTPICRTALAFLVC